MKLLSEEELVVTIQKLSTEDSNRCAISSSTSNQPTAWETFTIPAIEAKEECYGFINACFLKERHE